MRLCDVASKDADIGEKLPRRMLKANAEDVGKNALFLAPFIGSMPMVRGSSYYFGDVFAEAGRLLKNDFSKRAPQVDLRSESKLCGQPYRHTKK